MRCNRYARIEPGRVAVRAVWREEYEDGARTGRRSGFRAGTGRAVLLESGPYGGLSSRPPARSAWSRAAAGRSWGRPGAWATRAVASAHTRMGCWRAGG